MIRFELLAKSRFNASSSTDWSRRWLRKKKERAKSSVIFTPVTACDVNFYDACKVKIVIESQQAEKPASKSQPELTKCLQLLSIISDNDFDVFDDFDLL